MQKETITNHPGMMHSTFLYQDWIEKEKNCQLQIAARKPCHTVGTTLVISGEVYYNGDV